MPRHLLMKTCVARDGEITEPATLEPGVHAALYNIPEVRSAREYIEANPTCEGMWLRIGQRAYSLMVVVAEQTPPFAFELADA